MAGAVEAVDVPAFLASGRRIAAHLSALSAVGTARVLDFGEPGAAKEEVELRGSSMVILSGAVMVRGSSGRRRTAEILGSGDVLRPTSMSDTVSVNWHCSQRTQMARLDDVTNLLCQRHEALTAVLEADGQRLQSLQTRLAIAQEPALHIRLSLLLHHLSMRWGRVTRSGTLVPLRLTHAALAELCSSQRASTSRVLHQLASGDAAVSRSPAGWLLREGAVSPARGARR